MRLGRERVVGLVRRGRRAHQVGAGRRVGRVQRIRLQRRRVRGGSRGRWRRRRQHRGAEREVGAEIGAAGARGAGEAEVEVQIHPSAAPRRVIGGHPAGEAPTLVVARSHAPSSAGAVAGEAHAFLAPPHHGRPRRGARASRPGKAGGVRRIGAPVLAAAAGGGYGFGCGGVGGCLAAGAAGAAAVRMGNWEGCGVEREREGDGKHAVRARGFVVAGTEHHVTVHPAHG